MKIDKNFQLNEKKKEITLSITIPLEEFYILSNLEDFKELYYAVSPLMAFADQFFEKVDDIEEYLYGQDK